MRHQHKPGTFLRIPLADGTFAYGRHVIEPYTAFYNYRTSTPSGDLHTIELQPVLFRQAVELTSLERWDEIGVRPLVGEVAEPVVCFHQDVADYRKCIIYDSLGNEREATPDECVGLEPSSVWDAEGIEERLLATFEGRPWGTEHDRVRFENLV